MNRSSTPFTLRIDRPSRVPFENIGNRLNFSGGPSSVTLVSSSSSPSNTKTSNLERKRVSSEDGTWLCCECGNSNYIYIRSGDTPLGVLFCNSPRMSPDGKSMRRCNHKPCESCATTGIIKQFAPMNEPEVIPLSDDEAKEVRFGMVCGGCGLSMRAAADRKFERKIVKRNASSINLRDQAGLCPQRLLRRTRSITNPGGAPVGTNRKKVENVFVKQAEFAAVIFSGIECSCGKLTNASSDLCFQIVDPPQDFHQKQYMNLLSESRSHVGWSTTPELQARGHGSTELRIGRSNIRHPNPLRQSPVTKEWWTTFHPKNQGNKGQYL